jgi:exodeoxyribonuclease VII small subunit
VSADTYNLANPDSKYTMTKASQTPANGTSAQAQPNSYESAVQELEQLVARMESGQMPLADMLQSYQRGAFLLEHCRSQLQAVEAQIQVLEAGTLKNWSGATE